MNSSAGTRLTNPFPGLRPFREEEAYLFFGREGQVDRIVDKLATRRFLAVVGTSGSGKSSLVNCGLRPALRRGVMARAGSSWRMAQFRPGVDPIKALARSLAQPGVLFSGLDVGQESLEDMIEATLEMGDLGLVDLFEQARLAEGTNLILIVDQFEELFRYRTTQSSASSNKEAQIQEASIGFVNLLLAAAKSEYPIYVVLTMRSDFLGDCARFPGLPEAVNEGQFLVPRLTREERRAAISGPIAVGGGEISPVLLTRLVNDVGDNPDQLSILQHALNRTWAQWQSDPHANEPISLSHYEAIGTMAHALDRHAERAFAELTTERQRRICELVFQALTDKGGDARGIRRPTRFRNALRDRQRNSGRSRRCSRCLSQTEPLIPDATSTGAGGTGNHRRYLPRKLDARLEPAETLGRTRSRVSRAISSPGPKRTVACQGIDRVDDRP